MTAPAIRRARHRRRAVLLLVLAVLAVVAVVFWRGRGRDDPLADPWAEAQRAMRAERFDEAGAIAEGALRDDPNAPDWLLLAGEAAGRAGRHPQALEYLAAVPPAAEQYPQAQSLRGELCMLLGRLTEAEACFRRALDRRPGHAFALNRLAGLLTIEGRNWEAAPHLFEQLRLGAQTLEELIRLAGGERVMAAGDDLRAYADLVPDDDGTRFGLARVALAQNRLDEAEAALRGIVERNPAHVEAWAWLGTLLLERGDPAALETWQAALPAEAEAHPRVWLVRGRWAADGGDAGGAVRCFAESLRRDPNQRAACYQLGVLLAGGDREETAAALRQRAERLRELEETAVLLADNRDDPGLITDAAELCEALGRLWEARGWRQALVERRPDGGAAAELRRLEALVSDGLPRVHVALDPALSLDPDQFPLPKLVARSTRPVEIAAAAAIRFRDVAAELGIDFTQHNGDDPSSDGMRMFESQGGGVAALDYDGDRWPDLYFTQGGPWPPSPGQPAPWDRLFRNQRGERFADVAAAAGLVEDRFSHGVAAGDYDGDGFVDLFIANLGRNRLFRNNGDGTFADVTAAAGIDGEDWTLSCVLADLNGDGLADLYEVNYLGGDEIATRMCEMNGRMRACPPGAFPAADDRLWLNAGDGGFRDASASAGILVANGKGMGAVAADFDGSGRLSLFVANDMTPNFYFRNAAERGAAPRFIERGLPAGLALDGDGRTQASMGVALDDATGDGLLDLFVTNFYQESNTLYVQQAAGTLWNDATVAADLREPSYALLGFGTQFLDADLDGWPDLLVANGHIDDFSFVGTPFRMRPQFFRNAAAGRFVELPAAELGSYFQGEYLGRGMARLDYDRDGRDDGAISHILQPAALLKNESAAAGHFLTLSFRGIASERDAIGVTVSLRRGDRAWVKQLTAGDGFQASNERRLTFGLGAIDRVDELSIRWPAGATQSWSDVAVDRHYLAIEGRGELYDLTPWAATAP